MEQNNLTKITKELAENIIKYAKSKYSHGVVSVEGLGDKIFKSEYNDDYIYFDLESFETLKSISKKIKSELKDATTETN